MIYYIDYKLRLAGIFKLEKELEKKNLITRVVEIQLENHGINFSLEFASKTDIRDIIKEEKLIAESLNTTPDKLKITTPVPRSHSHCLTFTVPYTKDDEVKKERPGIIKVDTDKPVKVNRFNLSALLCRLSDQINDLSYKLHKNKE